MVIDYDRLRNDLTNYFGTAMYYNPFAQADLVFVSSCSDEELLKCADDNQFDLSKYERGKIYEKD